MPRRIRDKVWTPTKEECRRLIYDEGWPDQRVHDEGEIGWKTIKLVRGMHDKGLIPTSTPQVVPPAAEVIVEPEVPKVPGAKAEPKKVTVRVTEDFTQAHLLRNIPQVFTCSSQAVYIAMQIAKEQWGWPITDPGQFLDRFLPMAMEDYGFKLQGYLVLPWASRKPQGNGNVAQPEDIVLDEEPQVAVEATWTGE